MYVTSKTVVNGLRILQKLSGANVEIKTVLTRIRHYASSVTRIQVSTVPTVPTVAGMACLSIVDHFKSSFDS